MLRALLSSTRQIVPAHALARGHDVAGDVAAVVRVAASGTESERQSAEPNRRRDQTLGDVRNRLTNPAFRGSRPQLSAKRSRARVASRAANPPGDSSDQVPRIRQRSCSRAKPPNRERRHSGPRSSPPGRCPEGFSEEHTARLQRRVQLPEDSWQLLARDVEQHRVGEHAVEVTAGASAIPESSAPALRIRCSCARSRPTEPTHPGRSPDARVP